MTVPYLLLVGWTYFGGENAVTRFLRINRVLFYPAAFFLGWMLIRADAQYGFVEYFQNRRITSPYFEERFHRVAPGKLDFSSARKTVVVVLLESIENVFVDGRAFAGQDVMPGLRKKLGEHLSFHGHKQSFGTTWTIAGIVAYTFGMPLILPTGFRNEYGNMYAQFLPNAKSLFEAFVEHGYEVELMLGADKEFSGKDKLFVQHAPGVRIFDYTYYRGSGSDLDGDTNEWGVSDPFLYKRLKERLREKAGEKPYLIFFQTVNTHPPGFANDASPRKWGGDGYRDALAEADVLASDFIDWFEAQEFAKEATLIMLGDHILLRPEIDGFDLAGRTDREAFNLFINPALKPELDPARRQYASWDMAPTILEAVGVKVPGRRFGLGTSLFSPEKTLFEKEGFEYHEENIRLHSRLYQSFF